MVAKKGKRKIRHQGKDLLKKGMDVGCLAGENEAVAPEMLAGERPRWRRVKVWKDIEICFFGFVLFLGVAVFFLFLFLFMVLFCFAER